MATVAVAVAVAAPIVTGTVGHVCSFTPLIKASWRYFNSSNNTSILTKHSSSSISLCGVAVDRQFSSQSASAFPSSSSSSSSLPFRRSNSHRFVRVLDANGGIHQAVQFFSKSRLCTRVVHGSVYSSEWTVGEDIEAYGYLPPIVPTAIYGVGLNYKSHCAELKLSEPAYPVIFSKSITSAIGAFAPICIPNITPFTADEMQVDYEGELAVVIGKRCRNVSRSDADKVILGFTAANDVTSRSFQFPPPSMNISLPQWTRAKSFDSFCPLGPALIPKAFVPNPHSLKIASYVNGKCVQSSATSDMIFSIGELIEFLSQATTLEEGTVILTGTPYGVGHSQKKYLKNGDEVTVDIEGIGQLINPVVSQQISHQFIDKDKIDSPQTDARTKAAEKFKTNVEVL